MQLWRWCQTAYQRQGHRLSFPKNTDPRRTYQWRYLQALERRLSDLDISDVTAKYFIEVAAEYAKRNKLIHKGLSIFCQTNIINICYHRFCEELAKTAAYTELAIKSKRWLDQATAGGDGLVLLLRTDRIGAYPNLVKWYQAGHLNEPLLALSIVCGKAMLKLETADRDARKALPDLTNLHNLRSLLTSNHESRSRLQAAFGDDWRRQ